MLILECHIEISGTKIVKFDYVTEIAVKTSIKSFTGTAKITVPRKLRFEGKSLLDYINTGDSVKISMGYKKHTIQTVFEGYIKNVSSTTPIVIECEDEAYKLKLKRVDNEYTDNFSLNYFAKKYCGEYSSVMSDLQLGVMRIWNKSIAEVFEYLASKYPVHFFFREGKLYGESYDDILTPQSTITLTYGSNIISDTLQYLEGDKVKVAVKAKVMTSGNKMLEYITPSEAKSGGYDVTTLYYPSAKSVSDLKALAEKQLAGLRVNSMKGSITTFGIPFVRPGDTVALSDKVNVERDGKKFRIDAIEYKFGKGGYRQTIYPGKEIQ